MNAVVKYVVGHTYKPWLEKYLSKKRIYHHNGFRLQIPPEVFHPGFFFSTKFMMKYLDHFTLLEKSLLELGAGSGLISIHAAKQGARVTATDLNKTAVEYLNINAKENGVALRIIHSDLFEELPEERFDFIIINPPYYKKDASTEKELAWFCGSKGEYFERMFKSIGTYMHSRTEVLMVLCDGCDLAMIKDMSKKEGYVMNLLCSKKTFIETNFIFNIRKANSIGDRVEEERRVVKEEFRNQYHSLRKKEGRIYTDEQVLQLPSIDATHVYSKEWTIRKKSSERLIRWLTSAKRKMDILEIGCGNGWLSNRLAAIPDSKVTGIDLNHEELQQAKRVFHSVGNLQFIEADPGDKKLQSESYDVIVFAASIQYFKDLRATLQWALDHLNAGGNIHILDSHLYEEAELGAAVQRSRNYFSNMGFPAMSAHYFHHSLNSIRDFNYRMLSDPRKWINRLIRRKGIFHWIMIQHGS